MQRTTALNTVGYDSYNRLFDVNLAAGYRAAGPFICPPISGRSRTARGGCLPAQLTQLLTSLAILGGAPRWKEYVMSTSPPWGPDVGRACTAAVIGIDGYPVEADALITNGLAGLQILGLHETGSRETRDRVRAAILFPVKSTC